MDSLRQRITSFLELAPPGGAGDLRVVERTAHEDYTCSLIRYSAADVDRIEAFLLQPTGQRRPAMVLGLHQHNSQWSIGKSEIAGLSGDPFQAFGPALARRGITVLAPDAVGFESRTKSAGWGTSLAPELTKPHGSAEGWLQYYNEMAHRLVQGDLLMKKLLADCAAAMAVIQSLTTAQPANIGVVGHSFGGVLALFLAALDTRVVFACSSGAVCSFRHKLAHGTGLEMSLVIPGFVEHFDIGDLIRCVSPRRLFVVSSDDDPYTGDATELVSDALEVFEMRNCADHLRHLRVPGPHALDRRRFGAIVEWIVEQSAICTGS